MCLNNANTSSKVSFIKWEKDQYGVEFCWAKKIFKKLDHKTLTGPYFKHQIINRYGIQVSDRINLVSCRDLDNYENKYKRIERGFHVLFEGEKQCLKDIHYVEDSKGCHYVTVNVKCYKEDFVARGKFYDYNDSFNSAVFIRLEITEKEWNRIWKKH